MGADTPFFSLEEAVAGRARGSRTTPRFEWSWLPITRFSYGAVIVDCTVGDGAPSPGPCA